MRQRYLPGSVWVLFAGAGVVAAGLAVVLLTSRGDHPRSVDTGPVAGRSGFPARTIAAGAVSVSLEPIQIDTAGARFKVALNTHSVPLDMDLARSARLEVDGTTWSGAAWTGGGPGGHHRSGELRFAAAGPATGTARLTITGLPGPVTATWSLSGGG